MFSVGQVVVKIAGRDAGRAAVITEVINDRYVMIIGDTRKRKCNIKHLELIAQKISLPKNASDVASILGELQKLQLPVAIRTLKKSSAKKDTSKTKTTRPRKMHKQKQNASSPQPTNTDKKSTVSKEESAKKPKSESLSTSKQ